MQNPRIQEYFRALSGTVVRLSPYAVSKMGLVSAQTILKIENYMLICSPYELSMRKAVLLLILSRDETQFFQQYKSSACSLNLNFRRAGAEQSRLFNVKSVLVQLGPVKGKQNICMIEVSFTAYPPELIEILGDFIMGFNSLRGYYDSFQGREIAIDEETAKQLRFNNFAECYVGSQKVRASLANLSVNRLALLLPEAAGEIAVGQAFPTKLYFQLYQFMVKGKVTATSRTEGGLRIQYDIQFAPELVEILDDYFYRVSRSTAS
jgi:hypothetical protein